MQGFSLHLTGCMQNGEEFATFIWDFWMCLVSRELNTLQEPVLAKTFHEVRLSMSAGG